MGKSCLDASAFIFDQIIIKVAGNQDRHKSSDKFDFGSLVSMAHVFWNEIWPWHIGLRWAIVALWSTCFCLIKLKCVSVKVMLLSWCPDHHPHHCKGLTTQQLCLCWEIYTPSHRRNYNWGFVLRKLLTFDFLSWFKLTWELYHIDRMQL